MAIQWSLVIFTTLTGLAGWMFVGLAVAETKGVYKKPAFRAALVALIILIVGGCASVTHLSHPERMLEALNHPTSGIFTEAALVGITAIFAIIYLILLKRESSAGARKAMVICAAVFGAILSFAAGNSYQMASRATWNTILLPLGYLGTAIPAGLATYFVTVMSDKDEDDSKGGVELFSKLIGWGGVIAAVLAAAYVISTGSSEAILLGWVLAVIVGGVGSALFGFLMKKKPESATTYAVCAMVCAIVGAFAFRVMMWTVASTIDNFFSPL